MKTTNCKDDFEVLKYIEEVNRILSDIRSIEHKLMDDKIYDDIFEDYIIAVKINLKSIKTAFFAVDDIKSFNIKY